LQDREWLYAGGNVILSVTLCMIAVWLGWLLGSAQFDERKPQICKFPLTPSCCGSSSAKATAGNTSRCTKPSCSAREMHLAGATVLRGPMGFGKASRLHTAKILRLSMDLPLVIEIVDSEEKINSFLPELDKMIGGGLVTLEKVKVLHYRAGEV
jgi:PII-like signaling protein